VSNILLVAMELGTTTLPATFQKNYQMADDD
jgi:hypothetical protein